MSEKKKIEFLENYYYNSVNPAAYTSPEKLYQALKSIKNFKFSKFFIRNGLKRKMLIHCRGKFADLTKFQIFASVA